MISFHRFSSSRTAYHIAKEKERNEKRIASAHSARRQLFIAAVTFALVIAAATVHAHHVLAAHVPNDMPVNSRWVLTGHDATSNTKLGLWFACWENPAIAADHCRITDETGTAQYDGDMLPLAANRAAVKDSDLQFAKLDPDRLWVRGVIYDLPVPVLPLADGTQLVPVSDRAGLQRRLARGEWLDGLLPALPPRPQ